MYPHDMTRRTDRVNELLRAEISGLLMNEAKDPRITGLFSITQVEVSPDFRSARAFVSMLGDDEQKKELFAGLRAVAPFVSHELRTRLRMRTTPAIEFRPDDRIEQGAEVLRLLDQVQAGRPARGKRTTSPGG